LRHIVDAAKRYGVPLTMCGELAGKPLEALALMSIGMTRLSMGPSSIGPVKEMLLSLELEPIRQSVGAALSDGSDGVGIRDLLLDWVDRQKLPV
jgi:phosphotransferase system enzyme I (PtsP)